ncbi:DUF4238 domain-containing protein [Bradyrhizobium sp. HKCCYLS1011]|uniref:DUF4238 domain-containing protein n=1 Tax=Bradyrhizobium sp. HKCCYLS1011 TaxID=3420733 RepID=UPI003EB75C0C
MNAPQKPKRRHHHVWQHYLRPWTTDGALYCLQNGRIFPTGTRTVAVQNDFYKLHPLTAQDVALLKLFIGQGSSYAAKTHTELLNRLTLPFRLAEQIKDSAHRALIDAGLDEYASNVLEDYHASIEASFIPALERALKGDIGFYADDKECIAFLNYLCTQYMRTRGIKERVLEMGPSMERIWNIFIHMSSTNIGASLYRERKQRALIIVNNRTDTPFITGDQPAINLKSTRPALTDRLSIFYPISPRSALLMADVDEEPMFPADGLTRDQASTLNRMIFSASYTQAFARSAECLEAMVAA